MKILIISMMMVLASFSVMGGANNGDINGLEFDYERAFAHNHNGVTVQATVTNNTGANVKINEINPETTGADGFEIHHENSYSINGDVLINGEERVLTLLYFNDADVANKLETIQPTFSVEMGRENFIIDGEFLSVK